MQNMFAYPKHHLVLYWDYVTDYDSEEGKCTVVKKEYKQEKKEESKAYSYEVERFGHKVFSLSKSAKTTRAYFQSSVISGN